MFIRAKLLLPWNV
jgi:hypothetical protein